MAIKNKKGSLRQALRQAFSAFSSEHSGEMLSRTRKMQVLSSHLPDEPHEINQSHSLSKQYSSRRILVAIDKIIEPELLKYTIDAAKQFNASIDILSKESHDTIFNMMKSEANGSSVNWRLINLDKEQVAELSSHARNDSDVLFTITNQQMEFSEFSK